jgi:hypothetical protein
MVVVAHKFIEFINIRFGSFYVEILSGKILRKGGL